MNERTEMSGQIHASAALRDVTRIVQVFGHYSKPLRGAQASAEECVLPGLLDAGWRIAAVVTGEAGAWYALLTPPST